MVVPARGPFRSAVLFPIALVLLLGLSGLPQSQEPKLPLDDIVRHFAEKESVYAAAHAHYHYHLNVKVQEIDEDGSVVGEFEEAGEVVGAGGHRRLQLTGNPHVDLHYLDIRQVDLTDLEFVPLFILSPDEISKYKITYVSQERVDEVNTYLFRLEPNEVPRFPETLFEGIVWVDAHKLDVVRALGRLVPTRDTGVFNGYFRRLELYRQPVDDYLFTTFIRADDVISVRERPTRARLILRFSDYQRADEPAPPTSP
jgi:hypothetical protein